MRNLLAILYRPTETIQRILAQPRDRMVIPLVVLAGLSDGLRSITKGGDPMGHALTAKVLLIVIAVCIAVLAVAVAVFYLLAWVATMVGRIFEGDGTVREVRSALAWGLAPVVWSLLYRVPLAFAPKPTGLVLALLLILHAALVLWCVAITSITLGEALKFGPWSGLGTLVLTSLAPLVVMGAVALTLIMKR